ncbi:MAG: tRNA pseudouridine(55) synthase TruB [Planctomycetota bacterium]
MDGLLVVDKPVGLSSMDVVRRVRYAAREGLRAMGIDKKRVKCGHAGTLDPLASGVLVLGVGKATKAMDRVMDGEKRYVAGVNLAGFTATDDAEHEHTLEPVNVSVPPTIDAVRNAAQRWTGGVMQRPPAYSAVHVDGRRAYQRARDGERVELPARPVVIHAIEVLDYDFPDLTLDVRCAKGVYIRSLARDLGTTLGTGGYLTSLRRTAVGRFTLDMATPMERFDQPLTADALMPLGDEPTG